MFKILLTLNRTIHYDYNILLFQEKFVTFEHKYYPNLFLSSMGALEAGEEILSPNIMRNVFSSHYLVKDSLKQHLSYFCDCIMVIAKNMLIIWSKLEPWH